MFEKHFVLFTLTRSILRRYKGIPDRYRQVYHIGWQCGEILSVSETGFPPGDVLYITTSHIFAHTWHLFWKGSLVHCLGRICSRSVPDCHISCCYERLDGTARMTVFLFSQGTPLSKGRFLSCRAANLPVIIAIRACPHVLTVSCPINSIIFA